MSRVDWWRIGCVIKSDNKRLRGYARSALTAVGCACARGTEYLQRVRKRTLRLIGIARELAGDDAYERYLQHWQAHHACAAGPLDRKTFFKMELERKWNGIRRCC